MINVQAFDSSLGLAVQGLYPKPETQNRKPYTGVNSHVRAQGLGRLQNYSGSLRRRGGGGGA